MHHDPSGPTCVTTTKEITYDFYVTINKLAQAIGTTEIRHEIPLATHKAVKLGFLHGVTQRRVLVEQRIPRVSGATPIGPRLPPVDWSEAIQTLEEGLVAVEYAQGTTATGERRVQGREALEAAYPKFKLAMQKELQDLYGLEPQDAKELARKRELHWRPMTQVLHCKGATRPTPSRASLWAAGLLDQLGRLCLKEGPVDLARQTQIRALAGRALGRKRTPFEHHAPEAKSSWIPQLKRIGRIAVAAVEGKGTYRAAGGRAAAWAQAARCCYEIALPVEWKRNELDWKRYVVEATTMHTGKGHALLKEPVPFVQELVKDESGRQTAALPAILGSERSAWKMLWNAQDEATQEDSRLAEWSGPLLPKPTAEQLHGGSEDLQD